MAARRQAVITKYQKYSKSLIFRQQFQKRIYNNVSLEVPEDEFNFMQALGKFKATSETEICTRSKEFPDQKFGNTASESRIYVIDFENNKTPSELEVPKVSEPNEIKGFELRRVSDYANIPTAHQEIQLNTSERISTDIPVNKPKRKSRQKYQLQLDLLNRSRSMLNRPNQNRSKNYSRSRNRSKPDNNKPNSLKTLGVPLVSSHLKMVSIEGTPYFTLISEKNGYEGLPLVAKKHLQEEAIRNRMDQNNQTQKDEIMRTNADTNIKPQSEILSDFGDDTIRIEPDENKKSYKIFSRDVTLRTPKKQPTSLKRKSKLPNDKLSPKYEDNIGLKSKRKESSRKKNISYTDNPKIVNSFRKSRKYSSDDESLSSGIFLNNNVDNLTTEPILEPSDNLQYQDIEKCTDETFGKDFSPQVDIFDGYTNFKTSTPLNSNEILEKCLPSKSTSCDLLLDNQENVHQLILPPTTLAVIPASTFETQQRQVWKLPEVVIIARNDLLGQEKSLFNPIVIEAVKMDEFCDVPTKLEIPSNENGMVESNPTYYEKDIADTEFANNHLYIKNYVSPESDHYNRVESMNKSISKSQGTSTKDIAVRQNIQPFSYQQTQNKYNYLRTNKSEIDYPEEQYNYYQPLENNNVSKNVSKINRNNEKSLWENKKNYQYNNKIYNNSCQLDPEFIQEKTKISSSSRILPKNNKCSINFNNQNLHSDLSCSPHSKSINQHNTCNTHENSQQSMVEILRIPNTLPEMNSRYRLINSIRQHESIESDPLVNYYQNLKQNATSTAHLPMMEVPGNNRDSDFDLPGFSGAVERLPRTAGRSILSLRSPSMRHYSSSVRNYKLYM